MTGARVYVAVCAALFLARLVALSFKPCDDAEFPRVCAAILGNLLAGALGVAALWGMQ